MMQYEPSDSTLEDLHEAASETTVNFRLGFFWCSFEADSKTEQSRATEEERGR